MSSKSLAEWNVPEKIIKFLETDEARSFMDKEDFDSLYKLFMQSNSILDVRDLTTTFYKADIDPLFYCKEVPDYFLYGKLMPQLESYLKDLYLPEGIRAVGYWSFKHCKFIETIHIPISCIHLDEQSLYAMDLKTIVYNGTTAQWKKITKADKWCNKDKVEKIILLDQVIDFTED